MKSNNPEQKNGSVDIKNRLSQLWNRDPDGLQLVRNLKLILEEAKKENKSADIIAELKVNFPSMLDDYYAFTKNADHEAYCTKLLDQLSLMILAEKDPEVRAGLKLVEGILFNRNQVYKKGVIEEKIMDKRIAVITTACTDMMKSIASSDDPDSQSCMALLSAIIRDLNKTALGMIDNLQDSISFIIVKQFSDHPDLFSDKLIDSKLFKDMLVRMNINKSSATFKLEIGAIQSASINELKYDSDFKAAEREKNQFSFFLPIKSTGVILEALKDFKTSEAMTFFSALSVLMTGDKGVNVVNDREELLRNAMVATKKVYPNFSYSSLIEEDKDSKLALDVLRKLTNQNEDQVKSLCRLIAEKDNVEQKPSNK